MIRIEVIARPDVAQTYRMPLTEALEAIGIEADIGTGHPPGEVDYIVFAPASGAPDLSPFVKAKAVLGLWAGVETLISNPTLTQPFARMVDSGLTEGMVEWVCGHVLRHHLGMDEDILRTDGQWVKHVPPLARARKVGILGLGELGSACARSLAALNFDVAGWSRSEKALAGIACHHGAAGLDAVLARSEILVLLLPHTAATEGVIDAAALAKMPRGAVLLNPGRGALVDETALLAALDSGHLGHATLDTFRTEPLPEGHAFWRHPRVTVTPHIASETRPDTAAAVIAENVRRGEVGEPFLHLVDRDRGY